MGDDTTRLHCSLRPRLNPQPQPAEAGQLVESPRRDCVSTASTFTGAWDGMRGLVGGCPLAWRVRASRHSLAP